MHPVTVPGTLPRVLKRRINSALARTIGYELRRVGTDAPGGEADTPVQRPVAPPAAAQPEKPPPAPRKGRKKRLPIHYDEAGKEIIWRVKPRTMTSHEKLYALILATRYIEAHNVPGEVVECGVWRGGSMQAVAYTLLETGAATRDLHLFDTFEGMPPPTEKDRRRFAGKESAAELLAISDKDAKIWAVATLDDVREGMAETNYPSERIHYHPGMVEETVPSQAPESISLLRLDTDWYESTRHELEHLYDRLSPGGVIIIDDYGGWEGSRTATEEFLAKTGEPLLLLPASGGRVAVKPWRGA